MGVLLAFEEFLKKEFQERKSRNPNYSLRSFASSLETEASQLSKILTGKRRASPAVIQKYGMRLKLSHNEILEFQRLATVKKRFPKLGSKQLSYTPLSQDTVENLFD